MSQPAWDIFFEESIRAIIKPGAKILDVGGGLRVDAARGNVEDPNRAWIKPLLASADYRVMDPVDTYHPDIIGDVMKMPQTDATEDAIFCISVLEHVPRAWDAVREMHRVLKPGGHLFLHVPFLYSYHAMTGYYGDYVRFTEDGLRALLSDFADVKIVGVRGLAETVVHLLPRPLNARFIADAGRFVDTHWKKQSGKQTSGYYVLARKA
jgi:SAM-dependent methyltransferase